MKTFMQKSGVDRHWVVLDAAGVPLGRLASRAASLLIGKHKTTFTPHAESGDEVVVINAESVVLTGQKWQKKYYYKHSGIPGGFKAERYDHLQQRKPTFVVEKAIHGMLPKNRLGRLLRTRLRVYTGSAHPHAAQQPTALPIRQGASEGKEGSGQEAAAQQKQAS